MYELFAKELYSKGPFSAGDLALCEQFLLKETFLKNTIVTEQEQIPQKLCFILSGYMRVFEYDDKGNQITTSISGPGSFIASYLSLVKQQRSPENLECINDCEVLSLKRQDILTLIGKSEHFRNFTLIIFEQVMTSAQNRANDLAILSAEQRYKKLIAQQPDILLYVPVQHVASYLGIQPQSLSRIRRQFL